VHWNLRFGFGAVAGRGCGALPIDPEIIISEQARLGASVAWPGRSYSLACEKLNRLELVNEIGGFEVHSNSLGIPR
jgi:hypothetical protein